MSSSPIFQTMEPCYVRLGEKVQEASRTMAYSSGLASRHKFGKTKLNTRHPKSARDTREACNAEPETLNLSQNPNPLNPKPVKIITRCPNSARSRSTSKARCHSRFSCFFAFLADGRLDDFQLQGRGFQGWAAPVHPKHSLNIEAFKLGSLTL